MTLTHYRQTVNISATPGLVWSVMSDVERWPEWTASISKVKSLSGGLLQVGSRVWIQQPKLPPAIWRVTELNPGFSFTWVSRAPGVCVTALHTMEALDTGSCVTLSIDYQGLLGSLVARWVGELNERYLRMEAKGLQARCAALTSK
jgi:hypothetical protein